MSTPPNYNSLKFTAASNQYVDCGSGASLAVGETAGSQMSYSCWIKIPSNPAASVGICSKSAAGAPGAVGFNPWVNTGGVLNCDMYFNTHAQLTRNTGKNVADNNWHHIVVTNNSKGNSNIYCDGVLLTSDANGDFLKSTTGNPFRIGHVYQANPFNGSIADVRIFSVELSAQEIQSLFKATEVARGLVCRYAMREGGGTITTDTVGGVAGTLTNGPVWATDHPLLPLYTPPTAPASTGGTATQSGPIPIYYCWVTTWNTTAGSGTDPQVYISHELLEQITDPDANIAASGWTTSAFCPAGAAACELADQCELTTGVGNYTSLVNGVNCWSTSYYSDKGGGCVIPEIVSSTASGTKNFKWGGGLLLNNASICVIFAGTGGTAWAFTNSASPTLGSADDIKRGIQTLLTQTPFYDRLSEYSVNKPLFQVAAINTTSTVPNPFQESHIQQVVKDSISAGAVSNPNGASSPIIYLVVLNNTPHYYVNSTIGNHGVFQWTPPPPTSTPTTNSPGSGQSGVGPTSPSLQGDQWGITKVYPDKTTGNFSTAWFLPTNPNTDTRHVVDSTTFTALADGSYRNTQTNVVYNIAQQNGFTEASLVLNQATLATQLFMQDNKDWTNVEMTLYARVNAVANTSHTGPPNIILASDGARETNDATLLGTTGLPKSCEANDYRLYIEPVSGLIKLQKDLQYTAGITAAASNPTATSPVAGLTQWSNQFTGLKFASYNMSDGKSVALEVWMDINANNVWTQILRYVDTGNWIAGANACGGTTNQTLSWGGPLSKFIWNNISSIDIKYASIREIDVYALNPQLLVPPSNNPPTGTPTTSPGNNLPANPPPPNQKPPVSPGTGTLDKFGVKMIYPSISGGQSWYLSSRGLKGDSRVLGIPNSVKEYANGDGSFHMSTGSGPDVLFFVATQAGYNMGSLGMNLNHALCRVRQYMYSPLDWKNVEITLYHQIDMVIPSALSQRKRFDIGIKCRTGSHTRAKDCQGCAYEIQTICFPGSERIAHRKEHWHACHADTDRVAGGSFPFTSVIRRWIGQKLIAYNIVDPKTGHVTGVRLEHWWNDNNDGVTWTKVNSTTDTGGWGIMDGLCGGNRDEIIIWGGPLIGFFWDDLTGVCYKWMSIREIDPSSASQTPGQANPPGGPPSPSPGQGPPPKPPAVSALIGPNAYNVFRFPYNVILDDTGGCRVGIDPNAHLGQVQFNGNIPGTANQINLSNVAANMFLGGQRILNTSSIMYNGVLAEADFNLRIVGLPLDYATQPIRCTIRRGYDNLKVVDMGTIQPNYLTSQFQTISFKSPSLPNWTLTNGDIIAIEYYGGDASNYVQVQTDNTSGFDGANGAAVNVQVGTTTITTLTGQDCAGSFWSTGQTGVQPTLPYNASVPAPISGGTGAYYLYLGYGGATKIAQQIISAGSILIGKVIYEIDVAIAGPSPVNNLQGVIHVYIWDNNSGTVKADFGSLQASKLSTAGGIPPPLYPFFNYSNTWTNALNTWIVVEYVGGDAQTAGVSVAVSMTPSGGPVDSTNSLAYTSTDGQTWNLVYVPPSYPNAPNGSSGDLCALFWSSASPPVGGLPPQPGGTVYSLGNTTLANQDSLNLYGLVGLGYTAAGISVQDSQSKLVGKTIRGLDISMAQFIPPNTTGTPQGTIQVVVHKADGTPAGASATFDVSKLATLFGQFRFSLTINNPVGYKLQAGDKILIWYGASLSGPLNPATQPAVKLAMTTFDVFDGAHTALVTFAATGTSASSKYGGFTGNWSVATGNDLVCNIYYTT